MSKKYLYYFSEGSQAFGGDKTAMRNILGGKGSGLAEMTAAGMPVPQGFTITTEACTQYYADGRQINAEIQADIFAHVKGLEDLTGKKLGDVENPLLVSVRSGARQSMPGMMDTILNLGLNDASVEGLAKKTGNPRFAYDSYRRFVQMFADVVMGVSKSLFEEEIDKMKAAKGVTNDVDLDADDLKQLVVIFKKIYEDNEHKPFPQDPNEQLIEAVKAVFRSWDNPRANVYRKMNEIPYEWGTAVNVQQMAFGNSGDRSGTGVAFTRDPATGAKRLMGEYLINAQGEDVVAGVRTPSPISHLQEQMPEVYDEFVAIANRLEHYFKDMQDMEFTIEDGKLYMLQTRNGKRTAQAALQIACDLVDEGMITEREAVLRVEPKQLDTLLHPQFDAEALKKADAIGKGLAASPGSACGQIVFSAEEAEEAVRNKTMPKVVLVRLETSPEDIVGMQVSQGILTVRGGMRHRLSGRGLDDGQARSGACRHPLLQLSVYLRAGQGKGARARPQADRMVRPHERHGRAVHENSGGDPRQVPRGAVHARHAPLHDAHCGEGRGRVRLRRAHHRRVARSGREPDHAGDGRHRRGMRAAGIPSLHRHGQGGDHPHRAKDRHVRDLDPAV